MVPPFICADVMSMDALFHDVAALLCLTLLCSGNRPQDFGRALLEVVQLATLQLQSETNDIDVGADAAALQFAAGSSDHSNPSPNASDAVDGDVGVAVDRSNGYRDRALQGADSDAQSVEQLLRDGQREHVALHMAAEHELNAAAVLDAEADTVALELHAELVRTAVPPAFRKLSRRSREGCATPLALPEWVSKVSQPSVVLLEPGASCLIYADNSVQLPI